MALDLRMVSLVSFCLFQTRKEGITMSDTKNYMTIEDVMNELDVSRPTVTKMINEMGLKHMRIGRLIKIKREDFDEFIEMCSHESELWDFKYIPMTPYALSSICTTMSNNEIAENMRAIDDYYTKCMDGNVENVHELATKNNWSYAVYSVCEIIHDGFVDMYKEDK